MVLTDVSMGLPRPPWRTRNDKSRIILEHTPLYPLSRGDFSFLSFLRGNLVTREMGSFASLRMTNGFVTRGKSRIILEHTPLYPLSRGDFSFLSFLRGNLVTRERLAMTKVA